MVPYQFLFVFFMVVSVFNLFSIGIGPSSSHTVGPMRAARQFLLNVSKKTPLQTDYSIKVDLYGSLALTGKGHATDIAILLGLQGLLPENTDPDKVQAMIDEIRSSQILSLLGECPIVFNEEHHLLFHRDMRLPYHSNAMRFTLYDASGKELFMQVFYSVGGGFIVEHESATKPSASNTSEHVVPYPFKTGNQLLDICKNTGMTISQVMLENEKSWRTEEEIYAGLLRIWDVMKKCVERGCHQEGILPGGLNVKRRAPAIYQQLLESQQQGSQDPAEFMDWVSLWALAVTEENAAGGRVVTAPTNGASGVIPSVLHYYEKFTANSSEEGIITFMLTAGAIGILFKEGASLSAAEMGCQGEVGVACSMAAAGLAAACGCTTLQIENAAEIGMEHNLGLTCDPVGGLVQIPCIERNTMGAIKAINAARLASKDDGTQHVVTLDEVIASMRQIGQDMKSIYKETSLGGLAINVNVAEC